MAKANRLFDIDNLDINPNYISPSEKKKWNEGLKKYILEEYDKAVREFTPYMHCGYMKYCDECGELKYCNGCSDCLVAIKKFCKKHNIVIDYKDFDFKKIIDKMEAVKC